MPANNYFRNLGSLHDPAASIEPDRVAVIEEPSGVTVTYREFSESVAKAGNALGEFGVDRGDRVALCYSNDIRFLYTYFGTMRRGAVPVPVNIELGNSKVAYILEDCDASIVLVGEDSQARESVLPVLEESSGTRLVVLEGDPERTPDGVDYRSFEPAFTSAEPTLEAVTVGASDPVAQFYTSGSTGRPKGVVLTHGGAFWNTRTFQQINLLDESERVLIVTPIFHKMATVNLKAIFAAGGSAVILQDFDPETAAEIIQSREITFLTGVPAIYKLLIDSINTRESGEMPVQAGVCGGDVVPDSLQEQFEATFGGQLIQNYGLTEGGPMVTSSSRWGPSKPGSCGLALPGVTTIVVDPEGTSERPPGEVGELLVDSPGVSRYYNLPAENEESFVRIEGREYLRTGDLARKDEEGYHYIEGRIDDMFIVGGENVYPEEVESLLSEHPAVEQAIVVPVPHRSKGQAPVAFVQTSEPVDPDDLKQFTLDRGPTYAHPRRIYLVDSFSLTGTDKVDRDAFEDVAKERVDGTL